MSIIPPLRRQRSEVTKKGHVTMFSCKKMAGSSSALVISLAMLYIRVMLKRRRMILAQKFRRRRVAAAQRRAVFRRNFITSFQKHAADVQAQQALLVLMAAGAFVEGFHVERTVWCEFRDNKFWENEVPTYNDKRFLEAFRMRRATFDHIVEQLRPHLHKQDTTMRRAVPVAKRVAITIWRLARNSDMVATAKQFEVGKSTVVKIFKETCEAIVRVLRPKYLKRPMGDRLINVISGFREKYGFPQCAGAIDGTHIPIIAPQKDHADYFNRKQFHSVILQGVVDSDYRFYDINVGWPGRVHDARVFKHSSILQAAQNRVLFPNYPPIDTKGYQDKLIEVYTSFKNIGRDWIGPFFCLVVVVNPEYVKLALANADSKDNLIYNLLRPWLGDGLLTSEGSKWMRHRRLLTPGFHFEILRPYVSLFVDSTKVFLDKLAESKGQSVDVFRPVSLMTLDSLLKCSFSYDSQCQTDVKNDYTSAVFTFSQLFVERFRFIPYHFAPIFHLSPSGFRWRRVIRILHSKSEETIKERREELRKLANTSKNQTVSRRRKYLDFLDILLEARDEDGEGLNDLEIREEVDTFMFEGHDTTSSAISWCLYNLARFPDHQQKCYEEVEHLLQEKGKADLDWSDLTSLPFTTMFIKESLRFHAPVPGVVRTLIKDVKFPDGTLLPKGTCVNVAPMATHHHPLYWENPEVFDPYRFLPEKSKDRHSHAFVPFSAGPRNCIGQHFAMNELKVAVSMTVRRFQIAVDLDKPPEWTSRLVLRSLNGIHLKFNPR